VSSGTSSTSSQRLAVLFVHRVQYFLNTVSGAVEMLSRPDRPTQSPLQSDHAQAPERLNLLSEIAPIFFVLDTEDLPTSSWFVRPVFHMQATLPRGRNDFQQVGDINWVLEAAIEDACEPCFKGPLFHASLK